MRKKYFFSDCSEREVILVKNSLKLVYNLYKYAALTADFLGFIYLYSNIFLVNVFKLCTLSTCVSDLTNEVC